jgi:hypothetical protein
MNGALAVLRSMKPQWRHRRPHLERLPDLLVHLWEYWLMYRGPGFLVVVLFGSQPTPPALSCQQVVALSQSSCVSPAKLADGEGGGGGAKSYDGRKAWSSIKYSILSDNTRPQGCYSETGVQIAMERNFVCLWRRHNCNWSLPFCADLMIYEINYWVFKHAKISTLLIINLQWIKKINFAELEEIYNNVVPHLSAVLISCYPSITRIISFTKTVQNRDQLFLYTDPVKRNTHTAKAILVCLHSLVFAPGKW